MKYETSPVKIRREQPDGTKKGEAVGEAKYPVFDSFSEFVDWDGMSDASKLDIINTQVKTRALNEVRDQKRDELGLGPPSKTQLKNEAVKRLESRTMEIIAEAGAKGVNPIEYLQKKIEEEMEAIREEREQATAEETVAA